MASLTQWTWVWAGSGRWWRIEKPGVHGFTKSWTRLSDWTIKESIGASLVAQIVKNLLQCRRPGFVSWVRKTPWRREWQPIPVFLPRKFHGQRSLEGYSPWDRKESNMTEWLTLSLSFTKSILNSLLNTYVFTDGLPWVKYQARRVLRIWRQQDVVLSLLELTGEQQGNTENLSTMKPRNCRCRSLGWVILIDGVHYTQNTKPYQKPSPSLSWLSTRMARQKVSISRKGGSWFEKWWIYWSNIHVSLPSVKFLSPSSKITAGLHWSQNLLLCALSYHTRTHTHTHTRSNSVHKGILQFSYESLVLIKAITCWKKFQLNVLLNVTTFFTSNWNSQRLVEMYSCSEEECNDSEAVCSS